MFKNVKTIIIALLAIAIVAGCQGPPRPGMNRGGADRASTVSETAKVVYLDSKATFGDTVSPDAMQCPIDAQVMKHIQIFASKQNIKVILNGKPGPTDTILKISITEVVSFDGMSQSMVISGTLSEAGNIIASYKAARQSSGSSRGFGYRRGYAGGNVCTTLNYCAKTLGKDTASWMVNPIDGAMLGDVDLIH